MPTPLTSTPPSAATSSHSHSPSHAPLAAPPPPLATQTPPATPPLTAASTTPNDSTSPSTGRASDYTLRHSRIEPPPRPNYAFSHHRRHASISTKSVPGTQPVSRTASFAFAAADNNVKRNIPQLSQNHKHELGYTILSLFFHRWLPSLFSPAPIRHTFPRNLDNAVRALIAFIVAAVIAVQPWALSVLAVPYLFLVFAVVTVRPTVGSTILLIDAQAKGVLAAVAIEMIVTGSQVRNLSQTNRIIVVEILMFVTSIGLAYYFHPPLARRFSLAIHSLIMIEIALGVDQVILPLKILLCLVLAYCVSLVLVSLPFPRLAGDELLDRYQLALLTLSEVFDEIVACYLSTEPIAPQVLHTQVTSQLETVWKSLTAMRRLQVEMRMESNIFSLLSPMSMRVGNPVIADPDRIEQLYWIDANLISTLSSLHYSSYHAAFVHYLGDAFHQLSHEQSKYLRLLGRADSCMVTKAHLDECRRRLDDAMAESWRAYSRGRASLYGFGGSDHMHSTENVRAAAERRKRRHSIAKGPDVLQRHHSDGDTTEAGAAGELQESVRLLVKSEMQADKPLHLLSPDPPVLFHSTNDVFARSTFFFYIHRFHHAIHMLPLDEEVLAVDPIAGHEPTTDPPPTTTSSSPPPSSPRTALRASSWPRKRFYLSRLVRDKLRHPLSWSLLGLHPVRDFLYLFSALWEFVRRPSLDWNWFRSSVKISLIICVASLIAVIPQIGESTIFPNAYWAAFTAAILTSDSEGALWQRGFHRLFGTLLGGLIGYLIIYAFPDKWVGAITLLAFWCFLMQFVQNSSYNYLGALASFTPIVIIFGYRLTGISAELTVERYALVRMEEISIGVLVALLISTVLWPVSSIRLLRSEIMVSVESFKNAVGNTMDIYDRLVRDDSGRHTAPNGHTTKERQPSVSGREETKAREEEEEKATHQSAGEMQIEMLEKARTDMEAAARPACIPGDMGDEGSQPIPTPHTTQAVGSTQDNQELSMLATLLSFSNSVQMSLSRQTRLLDEAVNEPAIIFTPFPSSQYHQLGQTQRRIWSLILTLHPALEQIVQTQRSARHAVEDRLFSTPLFTDELRAMIDQVRMILDRCVLALQTGAQVDGEQAEAVAAVVVEMEAAFASHMNDIAQNVREGRTSMLPSEVLVPITVFLYSAVQLAEQVLILSSGVQRLLELEHPSGYDD